MRTLANNEHLLISGGTSYLPLDAGNYILSNHAWNIGTFLFGGALSGAMIGYAANANIECAMGLGAGVGFLCAQIGLLNACHIFMLSDRINTLLSTEFTD